MYAIHIKFQDCQHVKLSEPKAYMHAGASARTHTHTHTRTQMLSSHKRACVQSYVYPARVYICIYIYIYIYTHTHIKHLFDGSPGCLQGMFVAIPWAFSVASIITGLHIHVNNCVYVCVYVWIFACVSVICTYMHVRVQTFMDGCSRHDMSSHTYECIICTCQLWQLLYKSTNTCPVGFFTCSEELTNSHVSGWESYIITIQFACKRKACINRASVFAYKNRTHPHKDSLRLNTHACSGKATCQVFHKCTAMQGTPEEKPLCQERLEKTSCQTASKLSN
jgi:hypothetical protein